MNTLRKLMQAANERYLAGLPLTLGGRGAAAARKALSRLAVGYRAATANCSPCR